MSGGGHVDLSNAMFTALTRDALTGMCPCAVHSLYTHVRNESSYPQIHNPYYYFYLSISES